MKLYTKHVDSFNQFSRMRGVTDFSNAKQFNLFEKGYSMLFIIKKPEYIEKLCEVGENNDGFIDNELTNLSTAFYSILENEFKGLSGIEDITVDNLEVTDNISTMNVIGKVNKQSASEVSMTFTEKSGSALTNFTRYYLEGIKDPRTQAKTYHGLIKHGVMAGGFEHEVFDLLYVVLDNTMLQLEKAYLLCNAWPSKAPTSIYESEKGTIEKADVELTWQCFVIDGPEVDKQAARILAAYNETNAVYNAMSTTSSPKGYVAEGMGREINSSDIIHLQYDGDQNNNIQDGFVYYAVKNEMAQKSKSEGDTHFVPDSNGSATTESSQ